MTGWTDYAFSSDNVAAHQAGLTLRAPSLQVADGSGTWRTIVDDIGIPVGRPQTVVGRSVAAGCARARTTCESSRTCGSTGIRSWSTRPADASGRGISAARCRSSRDASLARVLRRGHARRPRAVRLRLRRVTPESPWKTMPGRYTREGDVRRLLAQSDDMFVIAAAGRRDRAVVRRGRAAAAACRLDADVPAVRRRLQQGDGHQLREPRRRRRRCRSTA